MYSIEKIKGSQMVIHSMWISVPNGYDEEYQQFEDYLVEEPNWLNVDEVYDWKKEVRNFIEQDAAKSQITWNKIRIWYDFGSKEVNL